MSWGRRVTIVSYPSFNYQPLSFSEPFGAGDDHNLSNECLVSNQGAFADNLTDVVDRLLILKGITLNDIISKMC